MDIDFPSADRPLVSHAGQYFPWQAITLAEASMNVGGSEIAGATSTAHDSKLAGNIFMPYLAGLPAAETILNTDGR
ncbi:hypothetical protein IB75_10775 [Nitrosococcus oceani C-27]|uniref:Uncharacterized protein n=1 Tax=Nitrosococcus oceani C-27 TaxID=314279 RepID=A0A0E2Z0Q3_9GAMM|nr:hypothetical protein IB75_10775 [Nitrosococcus oceani C-27]GEM18876.1 hypothetical protein NONS58_02400 [Nitrosococcus oceani]